MLIGADVFLHACHTFRNVWLQGRYGSGKTLLAVVIADQLQKRYHYSTYSNIPIVRPAAISQLVGCRAASPACGSDCQRLVDEGKDGKYHTTVVYDEAWMSLGAGATTSQIKAYLAYLRKMDIVLLMPSVLAIKRDGYLLWCQRKWNFGALGIPLWWYEWGLPGQSAKKSGGTFWLWRPQAWFGSYDTLAQPEELQSLFSGVILEKEKKSPRRVQRGI